jgi:hypothetical protein
MIGFALGAQQIVYFTSRGHRLQKLRRGIGIERKRFSLRPLHRSANQKEIYLLIRQERKAQQIGQALLVPSVSRKKKRK